LPLNSGTIISHRLSGIETKVRSQEYKVDRTGFYFAAFVDHEGDSRAE
jgi:hypothetical protein